MICEKIILHTGAVLETYLMDPQVSWQVYKTRPALIICPGGAYLIHAVKEGEPVAHEFIRRGYQCFVLKYTVMTDRSHPEKGINADTHYPMPVLELMEAMHIIHSRAEEWHIDPERIFAMGFSAGGHAAASLGVRWNDPKLHEQLPFSFSREEFRPAGIVLGYPFLHLNGENYSPRVRPEAETLMRRFLSGAGETTENINLINRIGQDTVPFFIWHSVNDPVVDSKNTTDFIKRLTDCSIPCEYHLYQRGEHGRSLANELTASEDNMPDPRLALWTDLADYWMKEI